MTDHVPSEACVDTCDNVLDDEHRIAALTREVERWKQSYTEENRDRVACLLKLDAERRLAGSLIKLSRTKRHAVMAQLEAAERLAAERAGLVEAATRFVNHFKPLNPGKWQEPWKSLCDSVEAVATASTVHGPQYVEHVHCSACGKRVSGIDPELGLVIRAYVQCPECIERTAASPSETTRCHAGSDGDCTWVECPQNREGEPMKSGRDCPLWDHDDGW